MSEDRDLFGARPVIPDRALTAEEMLERKRQKRRAHAQPRGHAWTPGSGPAGETCGTCQFRVVRARSRRYQKCLKTKEKWTGGPKSDIRASDAACKFWQAEDPNTPRDVTHW